MPTAAFACMPTTAARLTREQLARPSGFALCFTVCTLFLTILTAFYDLRPFSQFVFKKIQKKKALQRHEATVEACLQPCAQKLVFYKNTMTPKDSHSPSYTFYSGILTKKKIQINTSPMGP